VTVSGGFRSFVLEQLGRVVRDVRGRSMFGGVGIYSGDLFFALIAGKDPLAVDLNQALECACGS
jgi:TfoX/Sxy family transcriptional regulator of competence genes